jgi:sarcosine oxidase subunit alpha
MSGSFEFEGRRVGFEDGDTIASALYRAGIRTFTRSIKHHRRRGLYCMTGDCPNCMLNVDGEPGIRSCTTPARSGMRVKRESGLPSTELDLLSVTDRAHALMPVGFYHKTFIRPRFAWEIAERVIRSVTGVGRLPVGREPRMREKRHAQADVLVVGGGIAGLAAAIGSAARGASVILCDEGRLGDKVAPGPTLERIHALEADLRANPSVSLLERHTALGVYEGPLVPIAGEDGLLEVEPARIVIATGAVESHAVFAGNDLPGVWLGRGAARLAGVHSLRPGRRAVVAVRTGEGLEHLRTILEVGVEVAAAVVPQALAGEVPDSVRIISDGRIVKAEGRKEVRAAVVLTADGPRRVECDAIVLSLGLTPRDELLRMGNGLPVVGAGDVVVPGCSPQEAAESGRRAGRGEAPQARGAAPVRVGRRGYVCLCEDVSVADLEQAWSEGWRSSEILKRYTSATMGPCRGAMCGRLLSSFVAERSDSAEASARTTARPPVRPVPLETLASGVHEVIEKRTALHERHLQLGARLDWSGSWKRPFDYGAIADEYRAVRERVSLMDVGTLGKFLVAGRDAATLVDRVYPCRTHDLTPGRSRYMLTLDEAGYVMDDGMICALGSGTFYITSTSGGADRMEAWLRNWIDRWDLHVHLVNQTAMLGAINVAGPRARDLLEQLCDDPIDRGSLPHMAHRDIDVAGVPCRAIRVGFVGELSFELHHPRSRSVELWDALMDAGRDLGLRPHGLDALEILRMEKGHFYIGQDTLPDDHPAKLGVSWAVAMDKPSFVGKAALERMADIPVERRLVGLEFEGGVPGRGSPLHAGDRIVGRVTSCGWSHILGRAIGLGWLRALDGEFPSQLRAERLTARVVATPFYDPEGARLRA